MSHKLFSICIIAFIALLMTGCPAIWGKAPGKGDISADDMYTKAEQYFKDGDYSSAVMYYERLKSAHPDFDKMPEVLIKLGEATFEAGEYDKASARYRQFLELYPAGKDVDRAKYMVAMCYFSQIKKTDLDGTMLARAADSFKGVADAAKDPEWKSKAEEKYRECRKKLGEKELYKANTYVALRNYKAAKMAAQRVLDVYGDLGMDEEAKQILEKYKGE
ncbi:MAG: outer membrane protein assembly factor BamD [Pseudomonadota bacterium]